MAAKKPIVDYSGKQSEILAGDLIPISALASGTPNGTQFIRDDGTLAVPTVATPGTNTQVIFNDAGTLAGDADFTWNKTGNVLGLNGTDSSLQMKAITTEANITAPAAGFGKIYSKSIAGKAVPKFKGTGFDYAFQASIWQNNITEWVPTNVTAGHWTNTVGAGAGTFSVGLPTATNSYTATKRARYANVVTTTNQVLGQRSTELMHIVSSNNAKFGGFFFYARAGFDTWTNGGRFFAGMYSATTVISADPSALNNTVGFAVDAADNGAISFLTRGTAATKAATGFTITSNKGYDLFIYNAPNSTTYNWRIVDITTGTENSGTATLNPPAANTILSAGVLASNAALTTATAISLGVAKIYVESDY